MQKMMSFFADFQTLRDTRIKVYSRFEKKKKASRDIKRAALAQEQGRWSIPINSKFSGIELNCCMLLGWS